MVTKTHILQEIKRTAEANGGTSLGTARFEAETGIKKTDWFPKYWIRFGDAVCDAGYSPNRLKTRYEQTKLFEKYAQLAQELGELPVAGHLICKRRSDPDFPSKNVFSLLCPKSEFIGQLLEYCQSRKGYDDVVRMCEKYTPRNRSKASNDGRSRGSEDRDGYVYLMKSGKGNLYKIGRSGAVARRASNLRGQLPERLKTIDVIQTDDPIGIEAYWKKRFAAKRVRNEGILTECFELDTADVAAFKQLRVRHVKPSL